MKLIPIKSPRARKYSLYLRPEARKPIIYWAEYREDLTPQRQIKSTGFLNPDEIDKAIQFVEEQRSFWKGEAVAKAFQIGERWLFEDAAKKYLEMLEGTKAKKTVQNVKIDIEKHLSPEFGTLLPKEVSNELWLKYIKKCRVHKPKQKFFNRRKTLIAVLNYLHELPEENKNYLSKVQKFDDVDPEVNIGKYISDEKIKELLEFCQEEKLLALELQIQMGHKMGCRHGEIVRIEKEWIDLKEGTIHLPAHIVKTRKARDVRISKFVGPLIERQLVASKDTPFLFPSPRYQGRHMSDCHARDLWDLAKAKVSGVDRFHDLRHTCATNMAESSMPPYMAISQLGMSYRVFEKTYLKKRKSALKAAYEEWEGAE